MRARDYTPSPLTRLNRTGWAIAFIFYQITPTFNNNYYFIINFYKTKPTQSIQTTFFSNLCVYFLLFTTTPTTTTTIVVYYQYEMRSRGLYFTSLYNR